MCGIAGEVSTAGVDVDALEAMGAAIRHRGPDGLGYLLHDPRNGIRVARSSEAVAADARGARVGFVQRRLSILDLSDAGNQPMVNESGDLALVYNGEIYNYVELRRELEAGGRRFRSSGDTEVVLAAYERWGRDFVERLVGMWALALLDVRRGVLLLSRDRFGIKPLYYSATAGRFRFASEPKALIAAPGGEARPDEATVRRYLLTGATDQGERTFFAGISSVPAAHNLEVPLASAAPGSATRYWHLPEEEYGGSRKSAAREFAELLRDSVRVHTRSDVPVGTCLSGGLDSSAIVCLAAGLMEAGSVPSYAHRGFGYVPDDPAVSEREYMEEVVRRTGIEMTYVEVNRERFADVLPEIVVQQDEPFGSTSIAAQWFVFEAARRAGVKVMLDGQGADEVLGGYHSYFPQIGIAQLRAGRSLAYARLALAHRRRFGSWPLPPQVALHTAAPRLGPRVWPTRPAGPSPTLPPAAEILSAQMRERCTAADFSSPQHATVHDILAANTTSLGLPALLRFEDRNSMAHSIEARVPFLDHRLVEFAFRLPAEMKVHGATTKQVLRDALEGVLPERIRTRRDKIGFRADPSSTWTLAARHREALVANRTGPEVGWFDEPAVDRLLSGAETGIGAEFMAWRVINLKIWLRAVCAGIEDPLAP